MRGAPFTQSGAPAAASSNYAPLSAAWATSTVYVLHELVLYSGVLYEVTTAHTSGGAFDATKFTAVSSGGSLLTPTPVSAMGASQTIDMSAIVAAGGDTLIWDGVLSAPTCALTVTGFPATQFGQMLIRVHQDAITANRLITFVDTIGWPGGALMFPVMPGPVGSVLEFTITSLDGGTSKTGLHSQPIRTYIWGPGNATTAASAVSSPDYPVFYDARIVGGLLKLKTAGSVQSTIVDVNINGTTAYSTQGNRPTVATNGTSSGNITLPNTTALAAGQFVNFDIDQFGTSAAGLSIALMTLSAA